MKKTANNIKPFNENTNLTTRYLTFFKRFFDKKPSLVSCYEMSKRLPNIQVCQMKIFCKQPAERRLFTKYFHFEVICFDTFKLLKFATFSHIDLCMPKVIL